MIPANRGRARLKRPIAEVVVCRGRCQISAYSMLAGKGRVSPDAASRLHPSL